MKQAKVDWFFLPDFELTILVGKYEDGVDEKLVELFGPKVGFGPDDEVQPFGEHRPYGAVRGKKGGKKLLIWVNEPKVKKTEGKSVRGVLLHELTHVKRRVEDRFFKPGEVWPKELECYYLQALYEKACKGLGIEP